MKYIILFITCGLITLKGFSWTTPTINNPGNGSSTWTGVGFDWNAVAGSEFYEIQIDTSINFTSPAFQNNVEAYINTSNTNTDTYEFLSDLYFGATYYWRVRAINAVDTSSWTMQTIQTKDDVTLSSPNNFAVNQSVSGVGLNWDSHHGIDFYEVEWDTTNLFNSGLLQNYLKTYINTSNSNIDTYHNTGTLFTNQLYFWRIRAINATDTSQWTLRVFSTGPSIVVPQVPTLISPNAGATGISNPVSFDWNDANNATTYEIQYSLGNSFATYTSNTTVVSILTAANLLLDTVYYWRARSINGGVYSDWSIVWDFDTYTCTASASTINPIACDSYISPSGNYTWMVSGAFMDTIPNTLGCDSIITVNLTINTVDTSITTSSSTLTANASGAAYQWLDCNNGYSVISGENNQSFTPIVTGNYAVELTENGCIDTTACVAISTVGIIENSFGNGLLVYPNPTDGNFSIDLGETYQTITVTLVDMNGKLVQLNIYNEVQLLNLKIEEPAGVYSLVIESGNKKAGIRLVKE